MTTEILLSCMHQQDASIVADCRVPTNVVVVNQCDREETREETFRDGTCRMVFISTTERGLSRSRNKAIENATADLCMLADDDEIFCDDFVEKLTTAFKEHPQADVITFKVDGTESSKKAFAQTECRIGYVKAMQLCSVMIAFRRESVVKKNIRFDVEMGSGTGHGTCEEVRFLFDCLKNGLQIQHVPVTVARLQEDSASQWFKGYNERFFWERGWATERLMGRPLAVLYSFYYVLTKRKMYRDSISAKSALWQTLKGIFHR